MWGLAQGRRDDVGTDGEKEGAMWGQTRRRMEPCRIAEWGDRPCGTYLEKLEDRGINFPWLWLRTIFCGLFPRFGSELAPWLCFLFASVLKQYCRLFSWTQLKRKVLWFKYHPCISITRDRFWGRLKWGSMPRRQLSQAEDPDTSYFSEIYQILTLE